MEWWGFSLDHRHMVDDVAFFTGQLYWNQSLGNKIAFNLAADFNKAMYPRPFFIGLSITNIFIDLVIRSAKYH